MNDRLRRLLVILGPILGVLLLIYLVNAMVDTYSSGVEELRIERRAAATATAQAGTAITETTTVTGTTASDPLAITATESITSILAPTETGAINLPEVLPESAVLTGTETTTGAEGITATEAITGSETVTE